MSCSPFEASTTVLQIFPFKQQNMNYSIASRQTTALWGILVLFLAVLVFYLGIGIPSIQSNQTSYSKALKQKYNSIKDIDVTLKQAEEKKKSQLEISELWVYPIKSLRGARVAKALITPEGFYLDRRYVLLEVIPGSEKEPPSLKSMHVGSIPAMCLFQVAIPFGGSSFVVSFTDPAGSTSHDTKEDTLQVPLELELSQLTGLERVEVNMYGSSCQAYNMGSKYNDWFSAKFGFPVVLAFWGGNARPVLGNRPGRPANEVPKPKNSLTQALASVPFLGSLLTTNDYGIAFNDHAPFLVINETSVDEVTSRLGQLMDNTKFRPNIILKGDTTAWEEDFWTELTFTSGTKLTLTSNCVRCASLNVDYNTGATGEGKGGQALKVLQKDRRVDSGSKYSPVFGRYGFPGRGDAGGDKVLRVGEGVMVSKRSKERTVFSWPGLSTT